MWFSFSIWTYPELQISYVFILSRTEYFVGKRIDKSVYVEVFTENCDDKFVLVFFSPFYQIGFSAKSFIPLDGTLELRRDFGLPRLNNCPQIQNPPTCPVHVTAFQRGEKFQKLPPKFVWFRSKDIKSYTGTSRENRSETAITAGLNEVEFYEGQWREGHFKDDIKTRLPVAPVFEPIPVLWMDLNCVVLRCYNGISESTQSLFNPSAPSVP